jgi:protein-S-isoprenylcysteine O-methyltransferase Ste14
MSEVKFHLGRVLQLAVASTVLLLIVLYPGPWNVLRIIGLAIAVPALMLLFVARIQLGRSFAITPQAKELVTHGLYSRIRNPIYTFSFLLIAGLTLTLQRPFMYFLLALLFAIQTLRARREARVLEEKFGDAYRDYRKKTWF